MSIQEWFSVACVQYDVVHILFTLTTMRLTQKHRHMNTCEAKCASKGYSHVYKAKRTDGWFQGYLYCPTMENWTQHNDRIQKDNINIINNK